VVASGVAESGTATKEVVVGASRVAESGTLTRKEVMCSCSASTCLRATNVASIASGKFTRDDITSSKNRFAINRL
jgi:hypothetical protein